MKIEVTPEEAAAVYIGKAMKLMQTACNLHHYCDNCLLRNIESGKCALNHVQKVLELNSQ